MTATVIPAGTVVRCPKMETGKVVGHGRAVVLGLFNETDPTSGYLVWFYGKGAKKCGSLVFRREMTIVGTIEEMSVRTLTTVARGLNGVAGGHALWMRAGSLLLRKRATV
ncbi:DUF6409 family protein [Streptomyces sparsogenes]|uniref:DUF6409 family protein n=1 Tax=Streptomyces sparsogenes TaxID=67365 RepID=UPI0033EC56BE